MKTVNVPTSQMEKFEGMWVAIDTRRRRIIAVADKLKEISRFVTAKTGEEKKIRAAAFKVPRKDEGPYVLII